MEIRTPFKATVNSVELDGVPVAFTEEDVQDESRLAIQLTDDRVTKSGQLLRIRFEAMVTVYGTTFFAKVFDSQTGELGQDVVAGDATPEAQADRLSIQGELRRELVLELKADPPVFSPKRRWGQRPAPSVLYLLRALSQVPADLIVYDLAGRPVRHLQESGALNGPQQEPWDGLDDNGTIVPPGLYILKLSIDTDTALRTDRCWWG